VGGKGSGRYSRPNTTSKPPATNSHGMSGQRIPGRGEHLNSKPKGIWMSNYSPTTKHIPVGSVAFVKHLYPRVKEDQDAIERYRAAIDRLPPIVVARGEVLVDGFHRWQAHIREGLEGIEAIDLGNLSDIEIRKESIRRNASHGQQLATTDKRANADWLYRQGTRDPAELMELLSITRSTLDTYLRDAKRDEKEQGKAKAWEMWLDCFSYRQVGEVLGVDHHTVAAWCGEKADASGNSPPLDVAPHFTCMSNFWEFDEDADARYGDKNYPGYLHPRVIQHLLSFYTEPGQIVFDPFAGSGTTIEVSKEMRRRVWASDIQGNANYPLVPIHRHDITTGWPKDAPDKVDLIILDPPEWEGGPNHWRTSMDRILGMCPRHVTVGGHVAIIIRPVQCDDGSVIDRLGDILKSACNRDLQLRGRAVVPYPESKFTHQQIASARTNKRLLAAYKDVVLFQTGTP
jgi:hypothetical protein